ncbi:zinc finger protein 234-like [Eurosta solidaginis]|uniref:zinc finger protein 234-like n=1 Tax=Eurosta solidaginis TaxID=178769 RepID=UPI003530B093
MLKLLPNSTFVSGANAKCGEIYCHSSTEFTILCTHCELKSFDYEDFMRHIKNVHFENDLLKTEDVLVEVTPYLTTTTSVKGEVNFEDDSVERYSFVIPDDYDDYPEEEEQSGLRIVKWEQKTTTPEPHNGGEQNEFDEYDDEYIPTTFNKQQTKGLQKLIFSCEICSRTYKSQNNLRMHLEKFHKPGKTDGIIQMHKCDDCTDEFKTLRSLEEHCLTVHGGMKCPYCDKRCTCRTNQQRHIELHTHGNERKFACDYEDCTKRFFTRRQYQAHKRTHTRGKDYICDQCGYTCRAPDMLKVHYRSHTGERPFACDVCGKNFISKSAVIEHRVAHGTERPHVCQVCGRTFARAKSLYHHKFLHLDEKKFKCKICGQAYAQLAGLAGHMRRHREDGPQVRLDTRKSKRASDGSDETSQIAAKVEVLLRTKNATLDLRFASGHTYIGTLWDNQKKNWFINRSNCNEKFVSERKMLRNCILPTSYGQAKNSVRCGEIVCYDNVNFTIICVLCEMKLFEFDDFMLHYQNVHLRGNAIDSDNINDGELEACIKDEEFENVEYLAELNDNGAINAVRILDGLVTIENITTATKESNAAAANTDNSIEYENEALNVATNLNDDEFNNDDDADSMKGDSDWKPIVDEDEDNYILKKPRKPKSYQCEYCQKFYTTDRILKMHIQLKHLRPKDFKCEQCGAEYAEQRSLDSHIRKNHIGFPCTQCARTYKSARSLRVHMLSHKAIKEHVCDYENCGKGFVSATRLKVHQKIHTEERNYVCETCGYRTRQKDALVVHKRTHTGEKPFGCDICGRRFMSSSLLTEHKPMHSSERPHRCGVCGAAFSRAKALYHHKYLHLGVKKFVCKLCGRAYAQMAGLAGHMRQHRSEAQNLQSEWKSNM